MDSLTQAALGAAIGEAVAGRKIGKKAAVAGALIGTLPDLDILFLPLLDDIARMSFHRGFSHSILFCFTIAFLVAYILPKMKWVSTLSFRRAWFLSFFALFTHVLLDAFTTYGTQLLLPFSDWRVSFDSINIVDPFYTVPLVLGLGLSLYYYKTNNKYRSIPNNLGLILSSVYLLFTLANKQHIQREFYTQLESKNLASYGLLTVPVGIGNIQWYGVAKGNNQIYMGKYSILSHNEIDFDTFAINKHLLDTLDPVLRKKSKWIAQGYYVAAEKDGIIRVYNMQCDMQGTRKYGDYLAPTAFYYQIEKAENGRVSVSTGMHPKE